ncbi:hypothetical protein M0657_005795 [Pyricularia oryzae]|uniref:Uncharacterized protein n=1 Tax=Pyricularia oryzae TaxID=318829 RepID=A0A4P7NV32_PYROR|nr:hypothetical protein M9X92_005393 [Pyricularia oryzae]KAI7922175.1 hypothetical protein M0657_005795 [Pyricularia oryzae]QBZ65796.1 hypothetical protein PoMZ_12760 [Pyricularia oryzae]
MLTCPTAAFRELPGGVVWSWSQGALTAVRMLTFLWSFLAAYTQTINRARGEAMHRRKGLVGHRSI